MSAEENLRKRKTVGEDSDGEESPPNYESSPPPSKNSKFGLFMKVILSVTCGVLFGIAIEKGRVFEPRAIRYQMVFKKMIMLKMFMSAVGVGMFGLALLAMIPVTSKRFIHTCLSYYSKFTERGVVSSAVGGLLHGIGMTLCGTCPVMLFVQVGTGVPNVGYSFAGALFGTLMYGLMKPRIDKLTKPQITESANPWGNSPYFVMALPVAVMFGMVVLSIELIYPWTKDVKNVGSFTSVLDVMSMKAWPPFVSGVIVGSLQIPLVLGLGQVLGGSSSFSTMLAQVMVGPLKNISPFIAKHRFGFKNWWQIFYVTGVIAGGYLSASSSGYLGTSVGVPPAYAFIGSTILFFGARIAGGCTSGHGLSGMALLSILSVITVTFMFAGAIGTAFMMKQFGNLRI